MQLGTAPFEIGRSSKNDLFIDQESISRHHARITFDGTAYWVDRPGLDERHVRERRARQGAAPARRRPDPHRPVDPQVHDRREHRGPLPRGDLPPDDGGRPHADLQPPLLQRGARARVQPLASATRAPSRSSSSTSITSSRSTTRTATSRATACSASSSRAVKPRLRREDIFARTGGEEFGGPVARDRHRRRARHGGEGAQHRREHAAQARAGAIRCTVSLGVATLGPTTRRPRSSTSAPTSACTRRSRPGATASSG